MPRGSVESLCSSVQVCVCVCVFVLIATCRSTECTAFIKSPPVPCQCATVETFYRIPIDRQDNANATAEAPELLPGCLVPCTTDGSTRYTVERGPIRQKAATVGRTNYTGHWPFCLPIQTNIQMSRQMTELKRHIPVDLNG